MTTVQEEKLKKTNEVFAEHFDAHILIVLSKKEDGTNCLNARYSGGYYTVMGLLHETIVQLSEHADED